MVIRLVITCFLLVITLPSNAFISEEINGFEETAWYKSELLYSSPFVNDGSNAYRAIMYVNSNHKLSFAFEAYGLFTSVQQCKGQDKIFPSWMPEKVDAQDIKMTVACVNQGTTLRYLPLTAKGQQYIIKRFLKHKSVKLAHVEISAIGFNKKFKEIYDQIMSYNDAL